MNSLPMAAGGEGRLDEPWGEKAEVLCALIKLQMSHINAKQFAQRQ